MEIEKHFENSPTKDMLWTLHGTSRNNKSKITMDVDELIETYNLTMKELADIGIVNIRSN